MTPDQAALLARLARSGLIRVRDTMPLPVLDQLLALRYVTTLAVTRASMEFGISEAGRAALARWEAEHGG